MQQEPEAFSFEQALGLLRRRVALVVLCAVVVAGAAYGLSSRQAKKYTASASVSFATNPLGEQIAGLPSSVPSNTVAQQAQESVDIELVKSGSTAAATAKAIGHGLTPAMVAESLSVSGQAETPVVVVSSTTTSPALAAAIANTYVRQFVKGHQDANVQYLKSALGIVRKQLAKLSSAERLANDGAQLQNRAQTLSLLLELKAGDVQVGQEALPPASPSSPKTKKNALLGGLIGLIVGIGLALALERADRRIGRPEELEAIYREPLLGVVPHSSAFARAGRRKGAARGGLPPAQAEWFSLIRARLRCFNVNRELVTIVVVSAEPGDGKTMVARHLAEAAARSGTRVLLVEADLRKPALAAQLGVQAVPGFVDVLIGAAPLASAIQTVQLHGVAGEERALDVLPAGELLPPNPAELLESEAAQAVFARAREEYDLVVIDTPPLTAVSDAYPLLSKVDGVLVVARVGRSRRHAAERLHQVLARSGAPLLGVIANGSQAGAPGAYAYSAGGKGGKPAAAVAGTAAAAVAATAAADEAAESPAPVVNA